MANSPNNENVTLMGVKNKDIGGLNNLIVGNELEANNTENSLLVGNTNTFDNLDQCIASGQNNTITDSINSTLSGKNNTITKVPQLLKSCVE